MSQNCKDLLDGLLQRDPVRRISFSDFFSHPFIDLEHMPSEESLSKAVRCFLFIVHELFTVWQVSLVKSAIAKDSGGDSAAAINLYCESLEYFIPIIKCQHRNDFYCYKRCLFFQMNKISRRRKSLEEK